MTDNLTPKFYLTLKQSDVLHISSLDHHYMPQDHVKVITNGVLITKCIFTEKLVSETLRNNTRKFTFTDCIFNQGVDFNNHPNLAFSDCRFESESTFSGTKNDFEIRKSKFTGNVLISGSITHGDFVLEDCELENNLTLNIHPHQHAYLSRITTKGNIYIHKTNATRNLELSEITALSLEFNENVLVNNQLRLFEITVENLSFGVLEVKNKILLSSMNTQTFSIINLKTSHLEWGTINCEEDASINIDGIQKLLFRGVFCNILTLSGQIVKESQIQLSGSEFNVFRITNLKNEGTLELNQLEVKESFELLLSDLKKTDFIHCNMKDAKWIFKNSKIAEVFVAGTSFPKRVYNQRGIQDEEQARLAYGQLQKAMLNMGDAVNALFFQSSEIAAHYRQLKWNNTWKEGCTKFNLFLNWISNDFGRSWVRGIGFSFGFAILCFYGLTLSTEEYVFGWGIDFDPNLLGSFFRFINPLRFYETEKIYESAGCLKLTPYSYVIDFLSRVIIAYGFYQTIQAFRRLGKS